MPVILFDSVTKYNGTLSDKSDPVPPVALGIYHLRSPVSSRLHYIVFYWLVAQLPLPHPVAQHGCALLHGSVVAHLFRRQALLGLGFYIYLLNDFCCTHTEATASATGFTRPCSQSRKLTSQNYRAQVLKRVNVQVDVDVPEL